MNEIGQFSICLSTICVPFSWTERLYPWPSFSIWLLAFVILVSENNMSTGDVSLALYDRGCKYFSEFDVCFSLCVRVCMILFKAKMYYPFLFKYSKDESVRESKKCLSLISLLLPLLVCVSFQIFLSHVYNFVLFPFKRNGIMVLVLYSNLPFSLFNATHCG